MKLTDAISQIRTDNQVEVKKARKADAGAASAGPSAADKVDLSSTSRDVQKMKEILEQTPPMRMEMIESLKKQIDEGTYRIDARDIADKMMADLLGEETHLFE
ncbi:MAG: flagellar biosynthesis anti-sigma factor FlgM [Deltaproteobacteria bacterium]|nr:flagellar biosynthesis anti-sigma factor FlgM [Deltaproteobacteria bacterium]